MEAMDEVETRKQADLEQLLAKGWKRSDLSWFPPAPLAPESTEPLPTTRSVAVYDEDAGTFTCKIEPLTPARARRDADKQRAFDVKRSKGMWTIKHEALMRRHREEVTATLEAGRAVLALRWPNEAAIIHEAMTVYAERHERGLLRAEAAVQFVRVDRVTDLLPAEGAEIARLLRRAYTGPEHKEAEAELLRLHTQAAEAEELRRTLR